MYGTISEYEIVELRMVAEEFGHICRFILNKFHGFVYVLNITSHLVE